MVGDESDDVKVKMDKHEDFSLSHLGPRQSFGNSCNPSCHNDQMMVSLTMLGKPRSLF